MSYCRWSTDDFRCDLYIYDSICDVTEVHIARLRHTVPYDLIPPPLDVDDPDWVRKWVERGKAVRELMEQYPPQPIGGPYDGESLSFDTPADAADWIETELAPLGIYRYPSDLVSALRESEEEG